MRGFGRRVSFLALVALIATAALGSAYSLWSEALHVSAAARTGTLDAKIVCGLPLDNEDASWPNSPADPYAAYPASSPLKDLASVSNGSANGDQEWVISVSGAYPGYMFRCQVTISNTGTVPWHLEAQSFRVTANYGLDESFDCSGPYLSHCSDGAPGVVSNTHPIFVEMENIEGCQVHQGGSLSTPLFVGVDQAAHAAATYQITVKFTVNQWNESAWSDCGDSRTSAQGRGGQGAPEAFTWPTPAASGPRATGRAAS